MRILLTTDTVGGVWTFTRELTVELLRRGHSVALLSLGGRLSESQNAWVLATGRHYTRRFFHRNRNVPLEWMENNEFTFDKGSDAVMEMFDGVPFEPQLIHANQFPWASIPLGFPVVTTAHSDVLTWAEACEPAGLEPGTWLDKYLELVTGGLEATDVITAPTEWMAAELTRVFKLTKPVEVIPNGRDLTRALERASPPPERKLQAVSAARVWDKAKGLRDLRGITLPMPLLIAGAVELSDIPTDPPPLPAGAVCVGQKDEAQLVRLFLSSSVYLLASLYEPFGLAAVEAALCGCAVLARDLPSLREVWGENALFFADDASLQSQLKRLADDPELLAQTQRQSRGRAQQFSSSRMADAYLEQYRRAFDDADVYGDIDVDFEPLPPGQWEPRYES